MKTKYLIIGAGISGLTFASYCKENYLIIEKDSEVGGYCKTHYNKDYVWDYAGHFFHFKTDEFKKKFIDSLDKNDFVTQDKKTFIYFDDKLIDFPFQTHIHELSKDKFIDCLYDLFNKEEKENYDNFLDMLYGKFGKSITEMFLKPYNEKLYAVDLTKLDKDAMGRFFPYADIKAIIDNMKQNKVNSYNNTFMYPKKGAQVIIDVLMKDIDENKILLNSVIQSINLEDKKVILTDGTEIYYEYLINSMPFDKFLKLTNNKEYIDFSNELTYNKVLVFNLGFNKKSKYNDHHWLYFPDKNINFYRVGFYDNILGADKLSMYIEIGYPKGTVITDEDINRQLSLTLDNLKKCGIIDDTFSLVAYESSVMDPAYVHIDAQNDLKVRKIMKDLANKNVYSVGRYGAWTYCSMEDCMVEAKELSEKI